MSSDREHIQAGVVPGRSTCGGQRHPGAAAKRLVCRAALLILGTALFFSAEVLAQVKKIAAVDTAEKTGMSAAKTSGKDRNVVYAIDDKLYYTGTLKKSQFPDKFFYVKVLMPYDAKIRFGQNGKNGALVIITNKKFAVRSYQMKFSKFSKQYKSYMLKNQDNDMELEYVLDGKDLDDNDYDRIIKLYELSVQKIARVDLVGNPAHNGYEGKNGIVVINTKK